jgi:hypothetical protein
MLTSLTHAAARCFARQAQLTDMMSRMDEASTEVARLQSACAAAEALAFNLEAAASARQGEARVRMLRRACRCGIMRRSQWADVCAAPAHPLSFHAQLEATVSRLSAELASSREAAEGLRRDLHAAQTDGEGRNRQHDASTRDLRKELRDCDETIGCAAHTHHLQHACCCLVPARQAPRLPPARVADAFTPTAGACGTSCAPRRLTQHR